jgi:hypothetical protein
MRQEPSAAMPNNLAYAGERPGGAAAVHVKPGSRLSAEVSTAAQIGFKIQG